MAKTRCHVTFTPSAAGTLRHALQGIGRPDEVLCPFDDFSFGPIASETPSDRIRWVKSVLGYTDWADVTDRTATFLASVETTLSPVSAWVSRTNARSYAGFLWFLSQCGDLPISVIDAPGIPLMNADELLVLFDRQVPLSSEERIACESQWDQLKSENAPLRVIEGNQLVSAPIDYFDPMLLGNAQHDWQRMARIVGGVLMEFGDKGLYQTGDLVLGARLADLAEAGHLEWRGDLSIMRNCEIRLPASAP